ncbi:hypothetical protein ACJMK2_032118 [Sinanodonta woodiana]|uniref:Uncharacterized protein n=1 Tax=Sinanodonta woodiana TaxID=1069815 RepID=A0ABD3X0S9_SINWO
MNAPASDVVHFKVGELVSIKVPKSDRPKTDCKRILGILVNQHGEKDPSTYRGNSLLPFQGAIPELTVDGWKDEKVISLRTASMFFSKAACPTTGSKT